MVFPAGESEENMTDLRHADGSAGDANYGVIGVNYTNYRQPEAFFAARIADALGASANVLNVGAGAGSYEPTDRQVTALEPSAAMRAQRPAHLSAAIDGVAESLPFADQSFDASMSTFSVHQWKDLAAGLSEMRRVTRGPVLILTCDPAALDRFWLNDYAPEAIATEARRYPAMQTIIDGLGGQVDVHTMPVPLGCIDGFSEAYYGRPERLLEPGARLANSAWSFVDPAVGPRFVAHLGRDLADGTWDRQHGHLRSQPFFEGSLRLIVGRP
ncbi:SAM-dependent methyltransferase [Devosia sp. UYZn731]